VNAARAAQEYQAARSRAAREQQETVIANAKAEQAACMADRECAVQPVCQAQADLAAARDVVTAIRQKQARFGVIEPRKLSEAADDVIRLEGELKSERQRYRETFGAEAVCR
jgi:hypothetical protein